MDMTMIHDDGSDTRAQISELPPSTSVPEEVDVSEWKPTWTTGLGAYASMTLMFLVAALADSMISKYYAPSWGCVLFEWALFLVPFGTLLYQMHGCVESVRPHIESQLMRHSHVR
ncbi:hypothetical protein HPB52_008861 [Rhipicephalus sanguineus]|uniref:Uncharacterized protein n=1 Tax=Rhipicephalus sanguineus TaxID=34632 RepID=A0A9D4PVF5_RHISA|nr:hypothetical protein HPB52_008861 [Rhipicephalus sanguineus]